VIAEAAVQRRQLAGPGRGPQLEHAAPARATTADETAHAEPGGEHGAASTFHFC
jgi:hypothetical protein